MNEPISNWSYLPTTIAALGSSIAAVIGAIGIYKLRGLHRDLNGRLSQLLEAERKAAREEGRREGSEIERHINDH